MMSKISDKEVFDDINFEDNALVTMNKIIIYNIIVYN